MINFFILLILSTGFTFAGPREEASEILLRYSNESSISKRLHLFSRLFVGLPYGKGGPLGEGKDGKYDQDPLYRFDTFDCTTYVETIMALAFARNVNEFEDYLNKIRYEDGDVDYLKRNHFTDLQWIPWNIFNGYMTEINNELVDPSEIKIAEATINFGGWLRSHKIDQIKVPAASEPQKQALLEELHSEAWTYALEIARVPYIEIHQILATPIMLDKISSGTVVNFVRPNWDLTDIAGTHQNISHQGFLFREGRTLFLRHASTSGTVEQVPFIDYLKRFRNHPTLKGIHLMKVNQTL